MPAPFDTETNNNGASLVTADAQGNLTVAGAVTVNGGGILLAKQATAPVPPPGYLVLYSADGLTLSMVAPGGQAASQSVSGNLTVTGTVVGQQFTAKPTAATNPAFAANVNGSDGFDRFRVTGAGEHQWGPGTGARDVFMSRTAAGILSLTTGIFDAQQGTKTSVGATAITPTFANGTAAQLTDTTKDYVVYLTVGTAGTATTIKIGPTAGVANTVLSSSSTTSGVTYTVRLPAGWFLQWAGTTTTIANQLAVSC